MQTVNRPSAQPSGARESAGRLFLGVPLSAEVRAALQHYLSDSLGEVPGRPVRPESWHLTLRFLGETSRERLDMLVRALEEAPLGAAFTLVFSGPGAFPRPARAAVLWVGVAEGADALRTLAAEAETAARRAGFPAEERPFSPHLTLSRIQPPRDVRPLLERAPPFGERLRVEEVVLFRSHLGRGPARYEPVERFPLRP